MIILNITKVELNWFLVSEYDPNCEMETNCGDDGEEEEEKRGGYTQMLILFTIKKKFNFFPSSLNFNVINYQLKFQLT